MYEVHIQLPGGKVVRQPIDRATCYIGRDAACEITLEDSLVTRRHARLYRDNLGHFWVEDLRSKNGTTVNDNAITNARVREGDRIGIGSCVLTLHELEGEHVVLAEIETRFGSTSVWRKDQRFNLPQVRLEKLYELNERITGRFDRDQLLAELINVCIDALRFDRAGIALWPGEPHPPQWVALRSLVRDASGEFRISRSIVQRALQLGERILINDVASDLPDPTASMISNNIRSAICVPLLFHDKVHGVLYGDRVTATAGYTKEDVDFFAALARQAAIALANVQLLEERQQRQRVELQFQLARQIQNRLFPGEPLHCGGVTIEAVNDPGQTVSGDYFDYFLRPDGQIVFVLADVAGKGIPAALLMANLQAAVHVLMYEARDLPRAVTAINRLVCANVESGRFITGIFGWLDPEQRSLSFVNAGHPPILLVRAGGEVEPLACPPRLPLGVESDDLYTSEHVDLGSDPLTLFLYSDGVPDAANDRDERFGDRRIVDSLRASARDTPAEQLARMRRVIQQFTRNQPQVDDITMLAIRLA